MATIQLYFLARVSVATLSLLEETESTPLTSPPTPDSTPISPALPLMTSTFTSLSTRSATWFLYALAPTPTGSNTTGMPFSLAIFPERMMDFTVLSFNVPMFRTRAEDILVMSTMSNASSDMTGEPPAQMVTLAQSFTVT